MKKIPITNYQLPIISRQFFLCLGLLVIGCWLLVSFASAQTADQVILTWQANNFYPADYEGKAQATPGSSIHVAAEVIKNGQFLDLSGSTSTWYVDENFQNREQGLKELVFTAGGRGIDSHFVRVTITTQTDSYEAAIKIPLAKPQAVILNNKLTATVKPNSEVTLQAIPYFWNIDSLQNLVFTWQVNLEREQTRTNQLTIKVGEPKFEDQKNIRVDLLVQNPQNPLEYIRSFTQLFIQ